MRRLFYALFYRRVFGRKIPRARRLESLVSTWEQEEGKGDIPVPQEQWDADYLAGRWAFMRDFDELARYSTIVGYLQQLKPEGSILDVGCGEGILFKRYRPYGYSRYVGVDISEVAVNALMPLWDERTRFVHADAENSTPAETFDVIVFNEVLYYFHHPMETVRRYVHSLDREGIFIVSTFASSRRAVAILERLKSLYPLLHEATVACGSKSWICTVLGPLSPEA